MHASAIRLLALALGLLASSRAGAADALADLLACRDRAALDVPAGVLEARFANHATLRCKSLELRSASMVECDAEPAIALFGLTTREVGAASDRDGTRRVRSVYRASPARLRDAVAASLRVAFEAESDERWVARLANDTRRRIEIAPREDGSSVLLCVLDPPRDEAGDLALGIDRTRGGIAGRLAFPGGSEPPMRICAVPLDPRLRTRCIELARGRDDYLITGLVAGDYHVVAFALADNPNRLLGAYARPLEDCAPNQPGCAGGLLVPISVRAGVVATDIDPDRWFTKLPARFDEVREPVAE
jgi:hypothetical protein